ncbi:MAG: hypothetical protein JW943_08010 [Deltaproteobacteria bacterium]|nr:hypothetical protein [Deltaproteobacteria bacterium]
MSVFRTAEDRVFKNPQCPVFRMFVFANYFAAGVSAAGVSAAGAAVVAVAAGAGASTVDASGTASSFFLQPKTEKEKVTNKSRERIRTIAFFI